MNPKFLKFTKAVSQLQITGPARTFAIAAAVASTVADFVDVPATASDTPSTVYLSMAAMSVRNYVGEFNEAAPFDVRLALDLARKFWMTRYETLHVRQLHDACPGDYFSGYFNVARNFSEEEIRNLNDLSISINTLEIYTRDILRERVKALRGEGQKAVDPDGATMSSPVPSTAI
jgi:hypothetical protein